MSKSKKLILHPLVFLRDYLVNHISIRYKDIESNEFASEIQDQIESKFLTYLSSEYSNTIDIVYTWVNFDDNKWKSKFCEFYDRNTLEKVENRYKDHGELYLSLLSIQKFVKWIHKIYIVTDNQTPLIPEKLQEKVTIIDHCDIIDSKYLPTFNSNVIESFLHKIPDLSENFIYLNDDIIFTRKATKEHFFRQNGLCSIFVSNSLIHDRPANLNEFCIKNTAELLNSTINYKPKFKIQHTYIPILKSVMSEAFDNIIKDMSYLNNKIRTNQDIKFISMFLPYYQWHKKRAFEVFDTSVYLQRSKSFTQKFLNMIISKKKNRPYAICINDDFQNLSDSNDYDLIQQVVNHDN